MGQLNFNFHENDGERIQKKIDDVDHWKYDKQSFSVDQGTQDTPKSDFQHTENSGHKTESQNPFVSFARKSLVDVQNF